MKKLALLLAIPLAGCSGKGSSGGPSVIVTADAVTIDTGKFQVPDGESLTCIYTSFTTDQAYSFNDAAGIQAPGGHHITAYYTLNVQTPDIHPCSDDEMTLWNFVAGAGGDGTAYHFLPPGLGLKIPQGAQIVLQSHYINTTGAPEQVDDQIALKRVDPASIVAYAAPFVVDNDQWTIPANQSFSSTWDCTVPRDLTLAMMIGHEHTNGKHFTLKQLGTGSNGGATVLYDTDWQPYFMSHPPVRLFDLSAPLVLSSAHQLEITCDWQNDTSSAMTFPTEMCISFMYYYPGTAMLFCQ
jgi:hypothetical protein